MSICAGTKSEEYRPASPPLNDDPHSHLVVRYNHEPFSSGMKSVSTSWVFFAAQAKPTSMRRAIAQRLAEVDPVLVVEQPISVWREHRIPGLDKRRTSLRHNDPWLYRPLFFPESVPVVGSVAGWFNRARLKAELDALLPGRIKRVVCYDSPSQEQMVGRLGEDMSVYLAVDDRTLTVWGEPIAGESEAEKRLLQKVDKVVCVSEPLAETLKRRASTRSGLPILVLSNGYDERLFDPTRSWEEPTVLTAVPRPRILVAGHISDRIDWGGIAGSVSVCPEWSWVFVGPADGGMPERIRSLASLSQSVYPPSSRPAIVWLGSMPVEGIPGMIAHCDACAVPYRLNSFTRASSPLKAIEYLAMGVPVISTRVPSLLRYHDAIHWVEQGNGESYGQALTALLRLGPRSVGAGQKRVDLSSETWSAKALQFRKLVYDG